MTNAHGSAGSEPDPDREEFETVPLSDAVAAVDEMDPADEDWADLQWHVADGLHDRYLEGGAPGDLDEAIRRGRLVVTAQDKRSPMHLHDLALMLWNRFEDTMSQDQVDEARRNADLDEYVHHLQTALALLGLSGGDAELRAKCQANLATGQVSRTRYHAAEQDVVQAAALWEAALASGELDDDAQAGIAANLAQVLSRDGASEHDLRRAVDHGRRAVRTEAGDPESTAHNEFALAAALASLHDMVDDDGLLEEAIEHVRQGLTLLGPSNVDGPGYTANLIGLLRLQARETGSTAPLAEAVRLARETVEQTADGDLDRVLILTTSAAAISEAATQNEDSALLQEALALYRRAIAAAPDGSHEQGIALVNVTSACRDAVERLDALDLVEEGIAFGTRALDIFQEPDRYRAAALTATGNCLRDRFVLIGRVADLDQALLHAEEAVALTPERHPEHAARLTNLAVTLSDDFTERANRSQLDRAIALYRDALKAGERIGDRISERRNDLALALRDRHKDAGNDDDLYEAVDLAAGALQASRPGRLVWAGYANNLGNALAERYELDGNLDDLSRSVELFEQALTDAEGRVFESSGYATNLGLALATRARVTGAMADMDQSLLTLGRSIDLLPPEHPDRALRISNLADAYRQRSIMFDLGGHTELALAGAVAAVSTAEDAVDAAGSSDARLLPALSNLAEALRHQRDLAPGSVTGARIIEVQRRAATLDQITPAEKFGQAARWARDTEREGLPQEEALEAYGLAVGQTTEVAWIGLSVTERLGLLRAMNDVLSRAVECAAAAAQPWTAVAWADHVRSVLWRQGLLAASFDAHRDDPRLALLSGLQHENPAMSPASDRHHREQLRQWAHAEREALRVSIAPPEQYEALEFSGVVVLLVPGGETSSALLLRAHAAPQLVSLPLASRGELTAQVEALRRACTAFGGDDTGAELQARHTVFGCLAWLWKAVAAPILDEIASDPGERPQVWWSPVGEFTLLPIHAAGVHPRKRGQFATRQTSVAATVPDRTRSSYLPTVLGPRSTRVRVATAPGHLLYLSANDPSGSLTYLKTEHETVRKTLRRTPIVDLIDDKATAVALRDALPRCTYPHISAHGSIGDDDSFKVGFKLSDGVFTLRDLAGCDVDDGLLAILLACDSAAGDVQTPNEALHVAGAAHQAGFPDVIAATMPVRDMSSVLIVRRVYEALDTSPDAVAEVVPAALDAAVRALRLDPATGTDPLSWVPYAHFRDGLAAGRAATSARLS